MSYSEQERLARCETDECERVIRRTRMQMAGSGKVWCFEHGLEKFGN